jgi:5'-nucleotidase
VRILVTNDDGVHAPGLAALVRGLAPWAREHDHEVVVAAPLANYSGASAAVGTVYEREAIDFRVVHIDGAEDIPIYGLDAPPALTVIVGTYGAFGTPPDVVVSGINLGVNVGRSVLHSGTVGAALTAAQRGFRALAVSMRSRPEHYWETATGLALAVLPVLAAAPARTVLNLNVPALPVDELQGVVAGRIADVGIVQGAALVERSAPDAGTVLLTLGTAVPSLGDTTGRDPAEDASLIGAGFATLTTLHGVGEDHRPESRLVLDEAVTAASELLGH